MKRILLSSVALVGMAGAALAQEGVAEQVVAQLRDQGFTHIEVDQGPTQVKVEAIRGNRQVEYVYDLGTGELLSREIGIADGDDDRSPGVEYDESDEDFVGVEGDDGDEDGDGDGDDDDDSDDDGANDGDDDDGAGDGDGDSNHGHGNDEDGFDDDNPGRGHGSDGRSGNGNGNGNRNHGDDRGGDDGKGNRSDRGRGSDD